MMFDARLPCAFCDKIFPDFGPLAAHVLTRHMDVGEFLRDHGPVEQTPSESTQQWEDHGWFLDDKENDNMLPSIGGGKTPSQRTNKQIGIRKTPQVPFLTVEDVSEEPKTAKILGVQTQNTGFNDVVVKIVMGSRSYFLGLKASNPNYETLVTALGYDEKTWVGREFTIGLNWNEFYEKNFVHVFEVIADVLNPNSKKSKK
jgi:hypothetical protein